MKGETWERLKDVFAEALELPVGEREAFVHRSAADDDELLQELLELLAEAENVDEDFLGRPVAPRALGLFEAARDDDATSRTSLVGRTVGRWRLVREIGRGGMGVVYLAERVEGGFRQQGALKMVGGPAGYELRGRFEAERQMLAGLSHPGIARLLDGGSTDDGHPYLVMEYVEGETITRYSTEQRLTVEARIDLVLAISSAVQSAHQSLIVHRDLKPSNILVTADGAPKLLDFGIAKLLEPGDEGAERTRLAALTPEYASPEQIAGRPVSTASDVFSLGVLLYELLTGRRPFTVEGGSIPAILQEMESGPAPPSAVVGRSGSDGGPDPETVARERRTRPEKLRRRLRGDLDTIVLKALRKEPERRYTSALALAEDLRRYRDGLPVSARPDTLSYRTRRFVRRHWVGVAATATTLVALAGGLGAALWQGAAAERQRDHAQAEAATAESAVEFLKTVLWSGNPWDEAEPVETVEDVLRYAEHQLEPLLGDEPAARAYILAALSEIAVGRGEPEKAEQFSSEAMELLAVHPQAVGSRAGYIYRVRAAALRELGRHAEARELVARAIAELEAQRPLPVEDLAEAVNQAGVLEADLGNPVEAERWYRRALDFRYEHGATAPDKLVDVLDNLGVTLMYQPDRLQEAADAFDEAIPLARAGGAAPPVQATLIINQAQVLTLLEDFDAAEAAFLEALALMEASIGREHPSTLTAATSLGSLYELADNLERSEATLRPVLVSAQATLPPDHPLLAYVQNVLATTLCRKGGAATAEGLELARASFATRSASLPDDHWALASGSSIEGLCLLELGRLDEARPLLTHALPLLAEQRGEDHRLTTRVREWLARLDRKAAAGDS
jgi:eukaryotic-like serine/threonine-protein kinase